MRIDMKPSLKKDVLIVLSLIDSLVKPKVYIEANSDDKSYWKSAHDDTEAAPMSAGTEQ